MAASQSSALESDRATKTTSSEETQPAESPAQPDVVASTPSDAAVAVEPTEIVEPQESEVVETALASQETLSRKGSKKKKNKRCVCAKPTTFLITQVNLSL